MRCYPLADSCGASVQIDRFPQMRIVCAAQAGLYALDPPPDALQVARTNRLIATEDVRLVAQVEMSIQLVPGGQSLTDLADGQICF